MESTNFYATNFELGAIPPLFIHQLSRSRWRIDAEVFQTMTTDCHLKHPAVHQSTALVVPTMIRLLAYALSLVFYQRQIRSHARGSCDSFHDVSSRPSQCPSGRRCYRIPASPKNRRRKAPVNAVTTSASATLRKQLVPNQRPISRATPGLRNRWRIDDGYGTSTLFLL